MATEATATGTPAGSNTKVIIIVSVIVLLLIVGIVLIISSNKKAKQAAAVQAQMDALQQQAANATATQKPGILADIANLAALLANIKSGKTTANTPTLPGIGAGAGAGIGTTGGIPMSTGSDFMTWTPITSSTGVCKNPKTLDKTLLLKQGSINGEVCALQSYLNTQKGAGLVNDGNFGPKTQTALINAIGKSSTTLATLLG